MKKSLYTFLVLMLLMYGTCAEVPVNVIILRFSLHQDDKVDLINVRVDQGTVSDGSPEGTDYKLLILGENSKEIYTTYFHTRFMIVSSGTNGSDDVTLLNSSTVSLRLPYSEDGRRIVLYHLGKQIYSLDLSILCNKNNICDNYENAMTCPGDCMMGEGMPYCDMSSDGICNKHCPPEWDPDCLANITKDSSTLITSTLPAKNMPGNNEQYMIYVFLLVFVALILLLIYKGTEKKKIEKKRKEFISWKEEQEKQKPPEKSSGGL